MDEDSGCHGQDGDVLEEVTQRNNFTLKEHSEVFFFMTLKVQKMKCWKMFQIQKRT